MVIAGGYLPKTGDYFSFVKCLIRKSSYAPLYRADCPEDSRSVNVPRESSEFWNDWCLWGTTGPMESHLCHGDLCTFTCYLVVSGGPATGVILETSGPVAEWMVSIVGNKINGSSTFLVQLWQPEQTWSSPSFHLMVDMIFQFYNSNALW